MIIKRVFFLLLAISMVFLTVNINSYAVTAPELKITSNNYSVGDKMKLDEVNNVEVEKTLQLYAVTASGNDMTVDNNPDSLGWFINETNLSGVIWTSNDTSIATVDNNGKVTGVAEGKTTITAKYNGENTTYEINVKPKSESAYTGILFADKTSIPQQAMILNEEHEFTIYLYNIPDTEKQNIEFAMDNENVAKLKGIDLCNFEDGSGKGVIMANVEFLSLGQAKITATLNYNGKTYSDSYSFCVMKSSYTLSLSSEEYTDLPSSLNVGDKIQLIATFEIYGGSVLPEDVTSNEVTWISSNKEVVTVDNKGLVTAIGDGSATITAEYKVGEEILTATYNVKITDSTKSTISLETTSNPSSIDSLSKKSDSTTDKTVLPKTGKNDIIIIIGILLSFSISIIMYKNYKNIK